MNGKIKTQPQKRYYIQHREFFRFYFNFLNTGYFHYIQMAVKMKRGIESFFLKYLKLACKFKFTTPQRKILSMSCRRFNYINQNEWSHLVPLRFIFFLLLKICSFWGIIFLGPQSRAPTLGRPHLLSFGPVPKLHFCGPHLSKLLFHSLELSKLPFHGPVVSKHFFYFCIAKVSNFSIEAVKYLINYMIKYDIF